MVIHVRKLPFGGDFLAINLCGLIFAVRDLTPEIDNVAFGGFPLLQEFFYIIAASDKSLTHTKVAEDVDQAFTARR